jgi:hypothetical protein
MGISRIARGGHGIPKVLLGPTMPYPSTLFGWATPETAFWAFQGWPALTAVFHPLGHHILSAYVGPPKKVEPRGLWGG